MRRNGKGPNSQPWVGLEILTTASFDDTSHSRLQFFADQIAQALVLLDNENMIGSFRQEPLADAFSQLLKGKAILASHGNGFVNKVVERRANRLSFA